jgi:transposase InsO family protein
MMLDADVVAVSPSSVYRVLKQAGRLDRHWQKPSKKGTGFVQPLAAHDHWHVDMSYVNVAGTFYFLTSILDGYSRSIVHWELREGMTECDTEIVIQRAKERHPDQRPRIISDNGPQFIAKEFKEFIRIHGMTHVRTSPYYPQSNGKLERWHGSLKRECIRPAAPQSADEPDDAWPLTSSITTPCGSTGRSAMSLPPINSPDASSRSGMHETPSSKPREKGGPPHAKRSVRRRLPDASRRTTMINGLGGG